MNAKEANLYSFYDQCQSKGYSDMQDETQSLKAKVIATDLGIKYKDIAIVYEEAKAVYETENERRRQAEILQNTPGNVILTFTTKSDNEKITVFRRADGSLYHTCNESVTKFEGAPSINVHSGGSLLYSYHPSKTVFTGASSGPIAMGGFHETEAYYSEKVTSSGKGYIEIKANNGTSITVKKIVLSKFIVNKFKRVPWFKKNVNYTNIIYCYDTSETGTSDMLVKTALSSGADYYQKMNMISMAADRERLSMQACKDISSFLNDVLSERYPETDEQIYERACSYENAETSEKIMEGINIFKSISDYKDSEKRAESLQTKYEEVLQYEKEQAILKKEADAVKRKEMMKKMKFIIPAAIIIIIAAIFLANSLKKSQAYDLAMQYLDNGEFKYAKEGFAQLEGFKDSETMMLECDYRYALNEMSIKDYKEAISFLTDLGEYSDSTVKIEECYDLWIGEANTLYDSGEYKDAIYICEEIERFSSNEDVDSRCKELIVEINETIEAEKEAARIAEEKRLKEEAYETKDVFYFRERYMEYERLSGEDITEMIVGEWFQTKNTLAAYRYDYHENGKTTSYSKTTSGEVVTKDGTYSIDGDFLVDGTSYEIFKLEDGHYLMLSTSKSKSAILMWPANENVEETEGEIQETAVSEEENQ